MTLPLPIADAARELGVSRRTVERMLRRGAPFVRVRGRRHVDVDELQRWRRSGPLSALSRAIIWAWRGDAAYGRPAWRELALPEAETLALLLIVFGRAAEELSEELRDLPVELRHMESRAIALRASRPRR